MHSLLILLISMSCQAQAVEYGLKLVFAQAQFTMPVDLQSANDGSGKVYIVEKGGRILAGIPTKDPTPKLFYDLSRKINSLGNEEGLLGLAFSPKFKSDQTFYVYYSALDPRRSVISRVNWKTKKEEAILEVPQPYENHNGGQIAFGPDGYLYIALGDGGSGGDPHGHGQNLETLLGAILRIEVQESNKFKIPSDNPFVGNRKNWREEIYAYGLRNPWRFSFDRVTGDLWAGDVGQNRFEEVNLIKKGKNYGWNIMEATHCFKPSEGCKVEGLEKPIWEYGRSEGQSITGGYVYRGKKLKDLVGKYIFGDFVTGKIWTLKQGQAAQVLIASKKNISSFGVDEAGELYVCDFSGKIWRIDAL